MSADEARDQLPTVKVRLADGRIVDGYTAGRQCPFARVVVGARYLAGEWSWSAIARAATTGKPIHE